MYLDHFLVTSGKNKRTPIVLTRYKEHAKYLYDVLKKDVLDNTFLIYGDNTQKKNEEVRKQLLEINQNESFILVATSQSVKGLMFQD